MLHIKTLLPVILRLILQFNNMQVLQTDNLSNLITLLIPLLRFFEIILDVTISKYYYTGSDGYELDERLCSSKLT